MARSTASLRGFQNASSGTGSLRGSRESSHSRQTDRLPTSGADSGRASPTPVLATIDNAAIERFVVRIFDEYEQHQSVDDMAADMREQIDKLGGSSERLVSSIVMAYHNKGPQVERAGATCEDLVSQKVFSSADFVTGFADAVVRLMDEDIDCDVPKVWEWLAMLMAKLFAVRTLSFCDLPVMLDALTNCGDGDKIDKFVAHLLNNACKYRKKSEIAELWRDSGVSWNTLRKDCMPEEKFISRYSLEWLTASLPSPRVPSPPNPETAFSKRLDKALHDNATSDQLVNIAKEAPASLQQTPNLASMVTDLVAHCDCIINPAKNVVTVNTDALSRHCALLKHVLADDPALQLDTLFAIQNIVNDLEHPPGVIVDFFDTLLDTQTVSSAVMLQWFRSDDAQNGHGIAVKAANSIRSQLEEEAANR